MRFACPSCGKLLSAAEDRAGQIAKCPSCGDEVVIPQPPTAAAPGPAPSPLGEPAPRRGISQAPADRAPAEPAGMRRAAGDYTANQPDGPRHYDAIPPRRSPFLKVALLGGCLLVVLCGGGVFGLGAYFFVGWQKGAREEAQRTAARMQTKVLTEAVESYRITHGVFPPSLAALLQQDENGGPFLKNPDALIDPWGQPYQYNAAGPNNGGRQPDIWANSPTGPVGNWGPFRNWPRN